MKFGVLQFFSWPERRVPLPTVYERAMQRIAIMDQSGYDAVWLAEHHFTSYSVCPSVHLMGLWDGRYWHFEAVEVLPKPLQQPHPPSWIAAGSPDAVCWAGSRGYSIMLGPHTHYTDIARRHEMYRQELEAHGHTIAGRDILITRLIAVAETEPAAENVARRGAQWLLASYVNPTKAPNALASLTSRRDPSRTPFDPVAQYLDGVVVYGTPERVCDELQRLHEEMFLDYLLCALLSHASFMMFTEKVLPRLL